MRFELAREVFVCVASTDVPDENPPSRDALRFRSGDLSDLARLGDGDAAAVAREALARGDRWLLGETAGAIATWTFLSIARNFDYPALPG